LAQACRDNKQRIAVRSSRVPSHSTRQMVLCSKAVGLFTLAWLLQLMLWVDGTNDEGELFLEVNKKRPGVVTLPSGLQYKVLKKGSGKFHPEVGSPCSCHYAGTTPSLTPNAVDLPESKWNEFDSSYKRGEPTEFAPNQVIKGWTEAMQKMVVGDKWEMYIPSEMGYGDGGSGDKIKGGDVLIFRMEMLSIKGPKVRKTNQCSPAAKDECKPEELEIIEEWGKKSVMDIEKGVSGMKKKLKYENSAKKKEPIMMKMDLLKKLAEIKKKEEADEAKKKKEL